MAAAVNALDGSGLIGVPEDVYGELMHAHPSELDYSASPTLSRLMREFLLKVFARSSSAYGSAALEFAASMACGRMRLISEDLAEVREKALGAIPPGASALRGLLFLTDA